MNADKPRLAVSSPGKAARPFVHASICLALLAAPRVVAQSLPPPDTVRDLARRSALPVAPQGAQALGASVQGRDTGEGPSEQIAEFAAFSTHDRRRWKLYPQINVGWIYDTNVRRTNGGTGDSIYSAGASLGFDYGFPEAPFSLSSSYGLSYNRYGKFRDQTGRSQAFHLDTHWQPGGRTSVSAVLDFREGLEENYLLGAPQRTTQVAFRVSADHRLTDNTSWGVDVGVVRVKADALGSSMEESANLHADLLVTPKFRVGASLGGGLRSSDNSDSEGYSSARLRLNWQISGKLSVSGSMGADFRQKPGGGSLITPSGDLTLLHDVSDKTKLRLVTYTRIQPGNGVSGNNANTYGLTLGLTQALPKRFSFSIAGGYELAGSTNATAQDSQVLFVQSGLGWQVSDHLNATLSYSFFKRLSSTTVATDGYAQSQFSLGLGYAF